jgi:peptidyl-prolyl cis-trans isomerase SurA
MEGFKFFSSLIFLLVLSLFSQVSVCAEIANRVVAKVNNEVITLHELKNKIKELTGSEPADLKLRDEKKYLETRREILDLLIAEKIAREKIRELGIGVTPREVDAAIEKMKKDNYLTHEGLIAGLKKQGISYELYRENVKSELERMQLINFEVKSKIVIREEKIREYYDKHKDEFMTEEKVHLATILLRGQDVSSQDERDPLFQKAKEIMLRLKNGEDFDELAKKFSMGPGADEGGDLGLFKMSQLDPDLRKIIEGMSPGDVSEPIIRPSAIQVIKLVEKQERRSKPIDEVRDAIYWILYREEINKRYASWIKELRENAYTKIIF